MYTREEMAAETLTKSCEVNRFVGGGSGDGNPERGLYTAEMQV